MTVNPHVLDLDDRSEYAATALVYLHDIAYALPERRFHAAARGCVRPGESPAPYARWPMAATGPAAAAR